MADNLTIAVTADTTSLRAQLALAAADVRAYGTQMRQTAAALRSAGNDNTLVAQLNAQAGALDKATAQATRYKNEIKAALSNSGGGFEKDILTGARESLDALAMMSSRMRETAELAGGMFAIHEAVAFTREMAELGETTLNTAFSLGLTVKQVGQLSGMATLAGGDLQEMQRTLERLAKSVQDALANPNSQAAVSFRNLGISMADLKAKGNDLMGFFDLYREKVAGSEAGMRRTAAVHETAGRGMDRMAPLLRQNAAGYEELRAAAEAYANSLDRNIQKLDNNSEALNKLKLDWANFKITVAPAVSFFIEGLDNMVRTCDAWRELVEAAIGAVERKFGELAKSATLAANEVRRALTGSFAASAEFPSAKPGEYGYQSTPLAVNLRKPRPVGTEVPSHGGKGGAKGAAPITSAFEQADSAAQAGIRIDSSYLSAFKTNMQTMVDQKKITVAQMYGFDIQYTAQLEAQDQARLAEAMTAADAIVTKTEADAERKKAAQLKVWEQEMELSARAAASIAQDQQKIADAAAKAAQKAADAWAKPFEQAFDKLGSAMDKSVTDLLLRKGTTRADMKSLYQSMVGDTVSAVGGGLSKGAAGLLPGAKEGEGLAAYFGRQLAELILHSTFLAGILGNTAATAAASTASAGTSAASAAGGIGGLFSAIPGISAVSGWIGGLFGAGADASAVGADVMGATLALMSRGGIVPAASRGWVVPAAASGWALPSSFGTDRVPAMLTPGETVLPRHISDWVQRAAMGGDAGGHTFNFHIATGGTILDGGSFGRYLEREGKGAITAMVKRAMLPGGLNPFGAGPTR